jgi:lipopolysaccharide assembly outer membrane protein LptD (OstA)
MEPTIFQGRGAVWTAGGCLAVLVALGAGPSAAQQPVVTPPPAAQVAAVTPEAGVIDIQADSLAYDAARRLVIARGGVKVTRGGDSVSADYAEVDTAAEVVHARRKHRH